MSWESIAFLFLGILVGIIGMATYLAILINRFKKEIKCRDTDCDADWWKKGEKPPY